MAENAIQVVGNVTRDPELQFLNGGTACVNLSVAVNKRWQNKQTQEWEERVSYFGITAYGSLAENVANSISKGCRVVVTGRLEQRSWQTDNGENRSIVQIEADEISPSLRWATATVERNPRLEQGRPVNDQRPSRPLNPPATRQGYNFDEEPF